jgi:hypothetical protein
MLPGITQAPSCRSVALLAARHDVVDASIPRRATVMKQLLQRTAASVALTALAAAGLVAVVATSPAYAADPIVVDNTGDGSAGIGTNCTDATPGNCTFRDAVVAASEAAGADTVQVPAGTYTLSQNAPNCEVVHPVLADVTIESTGGVATIQGGASCTAGRVLRVAGDASSTATLRGLTITGGQAAPTVPAIGNGGGGVHVTGNLVLDDVTVTGNSTDDTSAHGGGVFASADLTITGSTISDNHALGATSDGGGVAVGGGTLVVSNSTISGNSATQFGGGAHGLAMQIAGSVISDNDAGLSGGGVRGISVVVERSSVTGNSAVTAGGGAMSDASSSVQVTDSTVTGNTVSDVAGQGGGLYLGIGPGTQSITVTRSTVASNTAPGAAGGIYGGNNTVTLVNSTAFGNGPTSGIVTLGAKLALVYSTLASNGTTNLQVNNLESFASVITGLGASNCTVNSASTSLGWNHDTGGTSCGLTGSTGDVQNGADAALAPLATTGTAPQTMRPLPGSPLLDKVLVADCPHGMGIITDERGAARPGGTACEIGAYEVQPGVAAGAVKDLPAPRGTSGAFPGPAVVKVKACGAATPACTAAQAASVATASPANGAYTLTGLYGSYVLTPYYCKSAACNIDAATTPRGPSTPVDVTEGIVPMSFTMGFRPDVFARRVGVPIDTGANVYSSPAAALTRPAGVKRRSVVRFAIRLQNDGTLPETIRLKATAVGAAQLIVAYRQGPFNIPNLAVGAGRSYTLAPGAVRVITVSIRAGATSKWLQSKVVALRATSTGQATGAKTDTIKVKAIRTKK